MRLRWALLPSFQGPAPPLLTVFLRPLLTVCARRAPHPLSLSPICLAGPCLTCAMNYGLTVTSSHGGKLQRHVPVLDCRDRWTEAHQA